MSAEASQPSEGMRDEKAPLDEPAIARPPASPSQDDIIEVTSSPCAMPDPSVREAQSFEAARSTASPEGMAPPPRIEAAPRATFFGRPVSRGLALLVLILLAAGLAALATLQPFARTTETERQALADHVAQLDSQVEKLTAAVSGVSSLSARLADLEQSFGSGDTALSKRVEALTALAASLSERLAALEAAATASGATAGVPGSSRALESELNALKTQVETLSQSVASTSAQAGQRLDALDARLAATSLDLGARPTREGLTAALTRIAALEKNDIGIAMNRATLALATSALAATLTSGAPYTEDMALVSKLAPADPAVATLQVHAATGVKPIAVLIASFPEAARQAREAERAAETSDGFWSGLWHSVTSLVSVSKSDETAQTTDAILARMQEALARGDLSAALAASAALTETPRKALAPWLTDAQARLDSETALRQLRARVLAELASPAPAATPSTAPPSATQP